MSQPYLGQIILAGFNFEPTGWMFCAGQLLDIAQYDALFTLIGTTYGGDGQSTFGLPDLRSRVPIHQGQGPGLLSYTIGEMSGIETVNLTPLQMPSHTHAVDITPLTGKLRCRNGAGTRLTPVGNTLAIEASEPFTDAPLVPGSSHVRAVHITELRTRVDALRVRFGLMPFGWTDPSLIAGTTVVRAQHIVDLRTALTQACTAGGLSLPVYAEPVAPGTSIKASHVTELRNAVMATPAGVIATYRNSAPDTTMNPGTVQMGGSATAGQTGGSQPHSNMQPYLAMNYLIAVTGIFPPQF